MEAVLRVLGAVLGLAGAVLLVAEAVLCPLGVVRRLADPVRRLAGVELGALDRVQHSAELVKRAPDPVLCVSDRGEGLFFQSEQEGMQVFQPGDAAEDFAETREGDGDVLEEVRAPVGVA